MVESASPRRLGPALIINAGVAVALGITILLVVWAQQIRTLPLALETQGEDESARVVIRGTDRLVTSIDGHPLIPGDLVEEPDTVGTWEELNAFYARQGALAAILERPAVRVTIDGKDETVGVITRGLAQLPLSFYTLLAASLVAWIVGFATYAFSDRGPAAQIYVFSAVAFCIAIWPAALYAARGIALPETTFRWLSTTDHVGALFFAQGVIGVVAIYPARLVRSYAPWWAIPAVASVLGHLQIGDMKITGFYTANASQFLLFLVFAFLQWRASRKDALQRAALGWILLSMFVGVIFFFTLITLPVLLDEPPWITQTTGLVTIVVMYVGISLGVLRFRLFELDRWWFRTWSWILGGMAVVGVDLLLSRLLDLQQNVALVIAVVVVGWVYFPLRQKLFERLGRAGRPATEYDTRELITSANPAELDARFEAALRAVFAPLEVVRTEGLVPATQLAGNGAWLEVPSPLKEGALRCHFRDNGARLYAREDVERANNLLRVAESVALAIAAREEGELAERNRIRRDLHDDLGASIIRIAHEASDDKTAGLAKAAMRDLRDVLGALQDQPTACRDVLDDLEADLRGRAHADGRELAWSITGESDAVLSARARANLTRVLRESMTNALKHGSGTVTYAIALDADGLAATVSNATSGDAAIEPGMGLGNITARFEELGGTATYARTGGTFRLSLTLPWSTAT